MKFCTFMVISIPLFFLNVQAISDIPLQSISSESGIIETDTSEAAIDSSDSLNNLSKNILQSQQAFTTAAQTARNDTGINVYIAPFKGLPYLEMTLTDAVDYLLEYNPDVNKTCLEWQASQDRFTGSFGIYEPALAGSYKHESSGRPEVLMPQIQNYLSSGVEGVLPSATKYNVGLSLTDYQYSFRDNYSLSSAFFGVTLTQPLLQGVWFSRPYIELKSTHIEREIALHKFRSRITSKIFDLENTYWKLCYAQEKVRYAANSVQMAQEILHDSKIQLRTGKISQLDAIEAQAGLATREAAYSDALKELYSAINDLKLLIAGKFFLRDTLLYATTALSTVASDSVSEHKSSVPFEEIKTVQPDYLQKNAEMKKEQIALDYQTDQCLPVLNLKSSFGYLATSKQFNQAWQTFSNRSDRSGTGTFTAEVEFRIPLGLNVKERKLRLAQRRMVEASEISLSEIQLQIENNLSYARKRITDLKTSLSNAEIVLNYRETLLSAETVRQRAGKSNFRKIFEIEEELTKSRLWNLENLMDYVSTRTDISRLTGTILLDKDLETIAKNNMFIIDKKLTSPSNLP